jgi:hypothetical protein
MDNDLQETRSIVYHLAIDGKKNNGWVKVSLKALEKANGLSFRMTSTDTGDFGVNTPLYFALDKLTVNTEEPTSVQNIYSPTKERAQMVLVDGGLMFRYNGQLFTLQGKRVE